MEKLLEHLYYLSPKEYQLMLSGPEDPQLWEVSKQRNVFEKYLNNCTLKEYCSLIIKAFKDKYPDSLRVSLLDFDDKRLFVQPDRPLRSADVERIDFTYKKAKLKGRFDQDTARNLRYLDELKISFKVNQPLLPDWVNETLQGKQFNRTLSAETTVFAVTGSPILKIAVSAKELSIFIDKNSFIEYIFQPNAYD